MKYVDWLSATDLVNISFSFLNNLFLGLNKKVRDYNLPRECIKRYFPSRKCFVFPFPVTSHKDTRLEILQDQDLAQQFLEVTGHFCDHMFVNSAVKRLKGGHIVTGRCECFTKWRVSFLWIFNTFQNKLCMIKQINKLIKHLFSKTLHLWFEDTVEHLLYS